MSKSLLGFVGDVLVNRDDPPEVFSEVRGILHVPDVLFGNLEGVYTDDPRPVPSAFSVLSAPAHNLDVYAEAGFDVMSLANNHVLDVGYEAMLETRARLNAAGVRTCGAGESLPAAREPAIVNAGGIRIAFLAYASIFPMGFEARAERPGLAPMRAYNAWREQFPSIHVPGLRPLTATVPDPIDLANLTRDIQCARERADLAIVSFHWGDHTRPFHLTDHETRTARYCIDHGAHMVVGHHHHAIRGMEWHQGKPILYGLGHFVFDERSATTEEQFRKLLADAGLDFADYIENNPYYTAPREGWPLLPMHEDTRMTMLAWATAEREGISDIGFLPCRLTPRGLVRPLRLDSPESRELIGYFQKCNRTQRLNTAVLADDGMTLDGFDTVRVVPA